jgi:TetR/AcrR family transcriptional regulator, transcriptional repressor for nem operon
MLSTTAFTEYIAQLGILSYNKKRPSGLFMNKGQQTKARIIAAAAQVFNTRGYSGASLYDIMDATQLQKGGIYRYFESKDALALAAFDFLYGRIRARYKAEVFREPHALKRILAILDLHGAILDDPYMAGGCPILNTAIEADDTHPELRDKAQAAMDDWRHTIFAILQKGMARGQVSAVDGEELATIIIAALEGAVMLAKLYNDKVYILRVINHLKHYVQRFSVQECEK